MYNTLLSGIKMAATCLNLASGGGSLTLGFIPGILSWRLCCQKDARLLSRGKRSEIELKIGELSDKLHIKRQVELVEIKNLAGGAQAQGNSSLPLRMGIALDPELFNTFPEAMEFLIAHELSHIKANDLIWMGALSALVGLVTTIAMSIIFPDSATLSTLLMCTLTASSPAALIGTLTSVIAFVFFSRWREECADKLAFSVCSDAGQKAAPEFFENIRTLQIAHRNNQEGSYLSMLWKKFLITPSGETRFDFFHPSLENRVNYLRKLRTPEIVS